MDYKKKYLEEKVKALQLEANLLQVRFGAIQTEIPEAMKELKIYEEEVMEELKTYEEEVKKNVGKKENKS